MLTDSPPLEKSNFIVDCRCRYVSISPPLLHDSVDRTSSSFESLSMQEADISYCRQGATIILFKITIRSNITVSTNICQCPSDTSSLDQSQRISTICFKLQRFANNFTTQSHHTRLGPAKSDDAYCIQNLCARIGRVL